MRSTLVIRASLDSGVSFLRPFFYWLKEGGPLQFSPYLKLIIPPYLYIPCTRFTTWLSFLRTPTYRVPGLPLDSWFFCKILSDSSVCSHTMCDMRLFLFTWDHSLSIGPTFRSFIIPMEPLQGLLRYANFLTVLAITYLANFCCRLFSMEVM